MSGNPSFVLGGRRVGLDYPPLVIAEIGINHEGSLKVTAPIGNEGNNMPIWLLTR